MHSPAGTPVTFELAEKHLPFLFTSLKRLGAGLAASDIEVILQTDAVPDLKLEVDGTLLSPESETISAGEHWSKKIAGLYSATVRSKAVFGQHTLVIQSGGKLGSAAGVTDILLSMNIKTKAATS